MGTHSAVVKAVESKSGTRALAEAVLEQAFRDLRSRRVATRDSARAFLLAEDEGWRTSRAFWATLAHQDVRAIEEQAHRTRSLVRHIQGKSLPLSNATREERLDALNTVKGQNPSEA